ncbi:MAG: GC-type dockerin domain-anchored protein [Phycisphaerales bacterium]
MTNPSTSRVRFRSRFRGIAACAAAVVCVSSGTLAQIVNPTLTDPDRGAVVGAEVVRRFFGLADARRVDLAIIGDSNIRNAVVSGHEDGMRRAFAARFGCYATHVAPLSGEGGWGTVITGAGGGLPAPFRSTNLPRPLWSFVFADPSFPKGGSYLAPGQAAGEDYNHGFILNHDHPLGIEGRLVYHLTHHTFRTPTDGRVNISVREAFPGSALNNYVYRSGIGTASASPGLADIAVEVPAGPRAPTGMLFCPADFANQRATRGPFFGLWQRVENAGTTRGIALSPLLYQGGRSARAAAESLINAGPEGPAVQEWLRQATRLQGSDRANAVLLVQIIHGGNDLLDSAPSLGPVGGYPSNSLEGYRDNMRGIINLLRQAWSAGGFDGDNLYFLIGPYHPRDQRRETDRAAERVAADLCGEYPNTMAVRGTMLSTEAEFRANGWYTNEVDLAHLSPAGFRAWGRGAVLALQRAACPADLNDDRRCTVEDLFAFVGAWFGGQRAGDFNRDGTGTIDDVFEFLEAYFRGCA